MLIANGWKNELSQQYASDVKINSQNLQRVGRALGKSKDRFYILPDFWTYYLIILVFGRIEGFDQQKFTLLTNNIPMIAGGNNHHKIKTYRNGITISNRTYTQSSRKINWLQEAATTFHSLHSLIHCPFFGSLWKPTLKINLLKNFQGKMVFTNTDL